MSKTTASGAIGLALTSALGSLCCLPIASGALGIALAGVAGAIGPWWPFLASASLVLLGITIVQTLRDRGGMEADRCEMRNRSRRKWIYVGAVAAVTTALLSLPWWSAELTYRLLR